MFDIKVFMVKKNLNNMGAKVQHKKNKNDMFNILQTFIFQPKTNHYFLTEKGLSLTLVIIDLASCSHNNIRPVDN